VSCSQRLFVIDIDKLQYLVEYGSRGTMFVHIPIATERLAKAKIDAGKLVSVLPDELSRFVTPLIKGRTALSPFLRADLFGDARRFGEADTFGDV
jgi:hypothetical protein